MFLSKSTLHPLLVLLLSAILVAAAPATKTRQYRYKVAKRADIVRRRATGTRPHMRRASPIPAAIYAVFENFAFGGATDNIVDPSIQQPSFDACARSCTAQSACEYFRYNIAGTRICSLRNNLPPILTPTTTSKAAIKGMTCAQVKGDPQYRLQTATCVDELY